MSKNAATEIVLGNLHKAVAEVMLKSLQAYANVEDMIVREETEDGNVVIAVKEPSAALLGAITKFLKDNEITCQVEESEGLTGLAARLKNKERRGASVVGLDGLPLAEPDPQSGKKPTADDMKALGLG